MIPPDMNYRAYHSPHSKKEKRERTVLYRKQMNDLKREKELKEHRKYWNKYGYSG